MLPSLPSLHTNIACLYHPLPVILLTGIFYWASSVALVVYPVWLIIFAKEKNIELLGDRICKFDIFFVSLHALLRAGQMKRLTYILFGVILLLSSCTTEGTRVCGVPVKGTPWELAAAIHDNGDGTFIPECVEVYTDKAYIDGWFNTNVTDNPYTAEPYDDGFVPAQVVCDVKDGKVTHAIVYSEILDKEE